MYEVKRAPPNIEDNIYQTVLNFFIYGLKPGSYTTFMLLHNFKRAKLSAHPMLLRGPHGKLTSHDALRHSFIQLPEFFTGASAQDWPGYIHLPDDERQLILDSYSDERVGEWHTYNAINNHKEESFRLWIDLAEDALRIRENV